MTNETKIENNNASEQDANNNNVKQQSGNDSSKKLEVLVEEMKSNFNKLSVEELIRGSTPQGIEERCLKLCQTYIGGCWRKITKLEEVEVTRITGGLTNQLYRVAIKDETTAKQNQTSDDEPFEVAIKLYQSKHFLNFESDQATSERLTDTIVLTTLSQIGIGPKVYGIFTDGFIQAYCKHEQFRPKHQKDPELVREASELLARCHHLSVPLPKNRDQHLDMMRGKMEEGYKAYDVKAAAEKYSYDIFLKREIRDEFDELCKIVEQCDSPMVFTHFDFRGSNILVSEKPQKNGNRLMICDFEYSAYGPRGFDLASIMLEWDNELFDFFACKLPRADAMENFVRLYAECCERLMPGYGKSPKNSVKQIIHETKVYLLVNYMFFIVFMFAPMKTDAELPEAMNFGNDEEQKFKYVNLSYLYYFNLKKMLIEDGTLSSDLFLA